MDWVDWDQIVYPLIVAAIIGIAGISYALTKRIIIPWRARQSLEQRRRARIEAMPDVCMIRGPVGPKGTGPNSVTPWERKATVKCERRSSSLEPHQHYWTFTLPVEPRVQPGWEIFVSSICYNIEHVVDARPDDEVQVVSAWSFVDS